MDVVSGYDVSYTEKNRKTGGTGMGVVRFATIGTSKIMKNFLNAAGEVPEFKLEAVYSRSIDKARELGMQYHAQKWYDSLDELAEDGEIDAVYIASPNALHCDQALLMMSAGKHVLCEKSIASNKEEAEKMFRTARENHVILLEAVRSVFDPGMEAARLNLGRLGVIRRATIDFCQYSSRYDAFLAGENHNIFNRKYSAGALMDIGVYCVHCLLYLFGMPQGVKGYADILRGEIDGAGTFLAKYQDMIAEVEYSKITNSRVPSEIQGEKGVMLIYQVDNLRKIEIIGNDGTSEIIYEQEPGNNMVHEIQHFIRMVQGKESPQTHSRRSLDAMELMDEVRRQCGICFPADIRCEETPTSADV